MQTIQKIESDGNRLFRAVAEALHMPEGCHRHLRSAVVNYLRVQRERFEIYNDTDYGWDEYLQRLSCN